MEPNTTTTIKDTQGKSQKFTKIKNRDIGTIRAFDYLSISSEATPDTEADSGTYIELGGNILIISTGESNREELNTMLSTFTYPTQ